MTARQVVARRTHAIGDATIHVVDGLFDEAYILMVERFMAGLEFGLGDYDTEETRQVTHWKHEFNLPDMQALPLIRELVTRASSAAQELHPSKTLELRRVHCNAHPYGDLQHAHVDVSPGVTAIYFANRRWEPEWMGETIFYGDDGEPWYAVLPKPGRLVVFDGHLLHRGGVPSRYCVEPRLSVAFKFAALGAPESSKVKEE